MSPAPAEIGAEGRRLKESGQEDGGELLLIQELGAMLERERVSCCQWKGHWKRHRWGRGEGDIDLLVTGAELPRFDEIVRPLGFKLMASEPATELPGTSSYVGLDAQSGRLVHVHVHAQVVLGHPWETVYRLPLTEAVLASAVAGPTFRIPAPELELLIFVLRMTLRHTVRGALRGRRRAWRTQIQGELGYLSGRADRLQLIALLKEHLPEIDDALYDDCLRGLDLRSSPWQGVAVKARLRRALGSSARRPSAAALRAAARDRGESIGMRRPTRHRKHPAGGGLLIALAGGDGAGKSTCARELHSWLSGEIATLHAHLGRPPRSLPTLAVGAALKASNLVDRLLGRGDRTDSIAALLRLLCTARDRYRLAARAARFAAAGGVIICERYPLPENRFLVGPAIGALLEARGRRSRAGEILRAVEERYYRHIPPPELVIVLRLDPEIAVRRKPEEPMSYVRARNRVIWETDWSGSGAHVLDASRPLPEVIATAKELIWSEL